MQGESGRRGNARRQARHRLRLADADYHAERALPRLVQALPPDLAARLGMDLLFVAAGRASHGALREAADKLGLARAWQERIDALYEIPDWG